MGLIEFIFMINQGIGGTQPPGTDLSLDFADDRNSQYIALIF